MGPHVTPTQFIALPLPPELEMLPATLWASNNEDVGCLDIPPFSIKLKEHALLPRLPQYKLPHHTEQALKDIILELIDKGVVEETRAPQGILATKSLNHNVRGRYLASNRPHTNPEIVVKVPSGERLRQGGTGNQKKEEPAAARIEANESL
ncbi:hypothetical protein NDU88_002256 [Pleurodeles waltl]|uniref:Uncharacterized protein n=1 Tax=Pleurodeles waltl TaxID=8319 RepID=A0AAV7M3F1_PLEWA|nr:hypothetical protein NDU88_002256 [Pleurodeles waltl]